MKTVNRGQPSSENVSDSEDAWPQCFLKDWWFELPSA